MKVEFGYGKGVQIVDIPDKNLDQILVANDIEHVRRGPDAVVYAPIRIILCRWTTIHS